MPAAEPESMARRGFTVGLSALLASACSRLAFVAANAPTVFGAYKRKINLTYGEAPDQRLDVYVPDKPADQPRPLVVFWHGGRWEFGDKRQYRFVGAALAELGFVTVVANYRMYPQVKLTGFMQDAARAAAWAVAHAAEYQANPARCFLMGHSSGAHMAALLTLDPRYFGEIDRPVPPITGFIGLSGPYDFLPLREADLQDMFGPPDRYALSQPINFVHAGAPPMLLVQGGRDTTVAPFNATHLAAALRAHDVPVTLRIYPKLEHAGTVAALSELGRGIAPVLTDIKTFVGSGALGPRLSDNRRREISKKIRESFR
jgi:acetyl esterase/lipase